MIVIDTSALMAILLDEPEAHACMDCLETAGKLAISAGTLAEALIVADRRGFRSEMEMLIDGLGCEIVAVTGAFARKVADAYGHWGKGIHPAALNYGDCFAYVLARKPEARLLFVGQDFSLTDLQSAVELWQ